MPLPFRAWTFIKGDHGGLSLLAAFMNTIAACPCSIYDDFLY
jgi:hypothetical protein